MMKFSSLAAFAFCLVLAGCNGSKSAAGTTGATTGAPVPVKSGVAKLTKLGIKDTVVGDGTEMGIKTGSNKPAAGGDMVTIAYTGKLTDGTVFDTNDPKTKTKHAIPLVFKLSTGSVVPGMDQGILGMKIGGERDLAIPAKMGYGPVAMGDKIPANSDLYFHVKLLDIVRPNEEAIYDFKDVKLGEGRPIKKGDTVTIQYTGYLLDGTVFDSNEGKDGYQFTIGFQPPQVISGMEAGVTGMKKGGERWLRLPPIIAYDVKNVEGVPPNSTLIFHIKILDVL